MTTPDTALQLRSTITNDATLRLTIEEAPVPEPGPAEVLIRVEASPINPSDLGMLFGTADITTVRAAGDAAASRSGRAGSRPES